MKIGVLGSGIAGRVLATAFLKEGHSVMLGTRDLSKDDVVKWKNENNRGETGSFEDTAQFGEVVVLATAGSVTEDAIRLAGTKNFTNKVVIDATNPIAPAPPENGVLNYTVAQTAGLAPGIYYIHCANENETIIKTMVKH